MATTSSTIQNGADQAHQSAELLKVNDLLGSSVIAEQRQGCELLGTLAPQLADIPILTTTKLFKKTSHIDRGVRNAALDAIQEISRAHQQKLEAVLAQEDGEGYRFLKQALQSEDNSLRDASAAITATIAEGLPKKSNWEGIYPCCIVALALLRDDLPSVQLSAFRIMRSVSAIPSYASLLITKRILSKRLIDDLTESSPEIRSELSGAIFNVAEQQALFAHLAAMRPSIYVFLASILGNPPDDQALLCGLRVALKLAKSRKNVGLDGGGPALIAVNAHQHLLRCLRGPCQQATCELLGDLALDPRCYDAIIKLHPCEVLVQLLKSAEPTGSSTYWTLRALTALASQPIGALAVAESGAADIVAHFLRGGCDVPEVLFWGCELLGHCAAHPTSSGKVIELNLVRNVAVLLGSATDPLKLTSSFALAKISSWSNGAAQILETNILEVYPILELLLSQDRDLREQMLKVVSNVAAYLSASKLDVLEVVAPSLLSAILTSLADGALAQKTLDVLETASWWKIGVEQIFIADIVAVLGGALQSGAASRKICTIVSNLLMHGSTYGLVLREIGPGSVPRTPYKQPHEQGAAVCRKYHAELIQIALEHLSAAEPVKLGPESDISASASAVLANLAFHGSTLPMVLDSKPCELLFDVLKEERHAADVRMNALRALSRIGNVPAAAQTN
ncbi:hypothetical protein MKEN_00988000 [Mycena kentingensis (nom. inval.)]|nr:hypothetical protein MKEN_00988000 [Mycena kentingensis (nom. inval.)]